MPIKSKTLFLQNGAGLHESGKLTLVGVNVQRRESLNGVVLHTAQRNVKITCKIRDYNVFFAILAMEFLQDVVLQ